MIWAVLLLFVLGGFLIKLGAMSVWVTVFSGALQVLVMLLAVFAAIAAWQFLKKR